MSYPDIGQLIPHEGDMILLDRVLAADLDTLCAEVTIRPGSLFCDGAGVGSWVGIEYMAQAIAAHAGYLDHLRGEPIKVGFLLGARRYQVAVPLFAVGAVLKVHIHHAMQGDNGLAAFECRIEDTAGGAVLANATVTVFVPNNVNEFLQRSFS
jgi:predicted hotdog family 3-hydroxylacyl-ACP dehydratase